MRRADDAGRHVCEQMRQGPLARPNRAWAVADDVAKCTPEAAEALPSGVKGDLGDRKVGIAEQSRRSLDAPTQQVSMRRHTEGLLERSREVRFGHAAHPREAPHGPFLMRRGVHPILRTQQAAQELGVLIRRSCLHVDHCTVERGKRRIDGRAVARGPAFCQSVPPERGLECAEERPSGSTRFAAVRARYTPCRFREDKEEQELCATRQRTLD